MEPHQEFLPNDSSMRLRIETSLETHGLAFNRMVETILGEGSSKVCKSSKR
jgi:hypothetical protein